MLHGPLLTTIAALLRRQPQDSRRERGRKPRALVVSDESSTPAAGRTLAAFLAAASRDHGLAASEVPHGPWRAGTSRTVRAFFLVVRGGDEGS